MTNVVDIVPVREITEERVKRTEETRGGGSVYSRKGTDRGKSRSPIFLDEHDNVLDMLSPVRRGSGSQDHSHCQSEGSNEADHP